MCVAGDGPRGKRWQERSQEPIPGGREGENAIGSGGAVGRDAGEVGAQGALQAPEVAQHLHPQPELGAVAAELAEAERHLGRHRLLAPKDRVGGTSG
jgi:hypothetical protein